MNTNRTHQNVTLAFGSREEIERAAVYTAALVREGVTFDATQINDAKGCEIMLVEFTGGY